MLSKFTKLSKESDRLIKKDILNSKNIEDYEEASVSAKCKYGIMVFGTLYEPTNYWGKSEIICKYPPYQIEVDSSTVEFKNINTKSFNKTTTSCGCIIKVH